jgi:hypothetical protein
MHPLDFFRHYTYRPSLLLKVAHQTNDASELVARMIYRRILKS